MLRDILIGYKETDGKGDVSFDSNGVTVGISWVELPSRLIGDTNGDASMTGFDISSDSGESIST